MRARGLVRAQHGSVRRARRLVVLGSPITLVLPGGYEVFVRADRGEGYDFRVWHGKRELWPDYYRSGRSFVAAVRASMKWAKNDEWLQAQLRDPEVQDGE